MVLYLEISTKTLKTFQGDLKTLKTEMNTRIRSPKCRKVKFMCIYELQTLFIPFASIRSYTTHKAGVCI